MLVAIRLSPLAKNVPQRNRCGYKFTHEAAVADLTKKQIEEVKEDVYLKVCNFPSVAWFQAFGIERTQNNEDKYRETPPTMKDVETCQKSGEGDLCNCRMAVFVGEGGLPPSKVVKTQPDATVGQEKASDEKVNVVQKQGFFTKVVELTASSPSEELVKALEKKGKKAGKDFDANAKSESLFALLKTL